MKIIKKNIYFISIVLLIIPELFFYSNDIITLFILLPVLLQKKINKILFHSILFILFILLAKVLIEPDFLLKKQFISDLRPFIYLLISVLYFESDNLSNKQKINFTLFSLILLTIPNIIGLLKPELYRIILGPYWLYEVGNAIGNNTNIAQIASLQGRFCSIFSQPATAGVFFFMTTIISVYLIKYSPNNKKKIYLILLLSIFNGIISGSGVYQYGFIVLIFYYFFIKYNTFKLITFFISFLLITILSTYLEELNILFDVIVSGRYGEKSNIIPIMVETKFENFIYGFTDLQRFYKVGGDSSLWTKFMQGGIIYLVGYYILLFKSFKNIFSSYLDNIWGVSIFLTLLTAELGLTSFSQPKMTYFIILLLLIFYDLKNNYESTK